MSAVTDQEGSAIVEFVFLGVLLMVPVAYLILTVGQLQGGAYAVVGASDQAAKVYVTQSEEVGARDVAEKAVAQAVSDMGFDPAQATLSITCDAGCLTPGTTVTAHVGLRIELPFVGAIPGVNLTAATVESGATQKVGRFK
ncbi:hypothetical protein [Arthrobacter cryoconiti]|nr:hypothetical protein [Arthrobacter cryoconiti]